MTTIARTRTAAPAAARLRPMEALGRRVTLAALERLAEGRLTLRWGRETRSFGPGGDLEAEIEIRDGRAFPALAFGGSVGGGEAYMEGWWESPAPAALVRLLLRNREALESLDRGLARLATPLRRLAYWASRNTRAGSRRNIAAHYDLSNDFFALFLDPTMTYSCAVFENGAETLEAAQVEKLDRCARLLDLRSGDHLLEIGTGWGSMAIHAAREHGCRVTTTTLSGRQAALARERVRAAGLEDRVEVVERDYRDLAGAYDKIVSIEMIEAVGARYYDAYFGACSRLLKPDGLMALQAITIRDQYFDKAARTQDWLKKHVFPGSCIPSVAAMQASVKRASDLRVTRLEDIGPHYVTTLRLWRERFNDRVEDVRAMGFDERFVRMWDYYLCYCEGAMAERHCSDVQVLLAKPRNRRAPVGASS